MPAIFLPYLKRNRADTDRLRQQETGGTRAVPPQFQQYADPDDRAVLRDSGCQLFYKDFQEVCRENTERISGWDFLKCFKYPKISKTCHFNDLNRSDLLESKQFGAVQNWKQQPLSYHGFTAAPIDLIIGLSFNIDKTCFS